MRLDLTIEEQHKIIVISAPSATGKTTIINELLKKYKNRMQFSVSTTTRSPRSNEIDGINYNFMSQEEFLQKQKDNYFIESAKVHNQYYGTSIEEVKNIVKNNKYCLLDVDIQGALSIKSSYPYSKFIFILPPSLRVLKSRLQDRAEHTASDIKSRLNNALKELSHIYYYDYYIVNKHLENSIHTIEDIIFNEDSESNQK